jgi:RHS repeat-associated protein
VGSPVSAAANGASITLTYATAGAVGNGVTMSGSSQSTQTHWTFSPPSFSSAGTTLANGLNVGDVSNNPLVTLYQYDALGNLTCVEQHGDAATGTGCSAAPSADATSPWRVRRFTYDSLSRLLTATNPESGAISYSYDADGNVSTKTDARGIITSFYYDELHRITSKSHSDGSLGAGYVYDQKGVWGTPGNNAVGRLVLEYDGSHAATLFSYDALGRINQQWDCPPSAFGVGCPMVQANYDLAGDLTQLTYPNGEMANFSIDSAGRTLSAVDGGGSPNFVSSATYGPDSGLTGFVSGSGGAEAITSSFSYNKRLQPVSMSATAPSQTVFSIGYDFHAGNGTAGTGADNGNVWGIYNYRDRTRDQSFTYDPLNRLTSAQNAGANCAATTANGRTEYWGNSYSYDAWGNLTNKTITKCGAENLSVAALVNNQLSGYSYDAAGNMTNDGLGHAFTYDGEGRISQINSGAVQYTYDPEMGRVRKDVSGQPSTEYYYFGSEVVAEQNVSTSAWTNYVFFDGERVARREYPAGNVFYYFSDHLKTASVITDASGTIKSESDYYPWGGELQFTANDSNHYKFTGKERDSESGLDYFGARYYSNGLGRFVTPDWSSNPVPVPYADLGDPQSLNQYSYVRNVPTVKVDLDGHGCPPVCDLPTPTAEDWKSIEEAGKRLGEASRLASVARITIGTAVLFTAYAASPFIQTVGQSDADERAAIKQASEERAAQNGGVDPQQAPEPAAAGGGARQGGGGFRYENPGHHDPTSPNFVPGKTPLPTDAESVFGTAIPVTGRAPGTGELSYGLSETGASIIGIQVKMECYTLAAQYKLITCQKKSESNSSSRPRNEPRRRSKTGKNENSCILFARWQPLELCSRI